MATLQASLTTGFVWMALFWLTYFPTRILTNKKGIIYSLPFLINMLIGCYIILIIQPTLLQAMGINSKILNLLAIAMTFALISHHITQEAENKFRNYKSIKLIHHQVSHITFFIAFGISSLIIGLKLRQLALPNEISIILVFLFLMFFFSTIGILVGLGRIKLWYT